MRVPTVFLTAVLLATTAAYAHADGSKEETARAIGDTSSLVLFSLEPGPLGKRDSKGVCVGDCFFGWPVLGQATVPTSSDQPIRETLSSWVSAPPSHQMAMCFSPRHGVRIQAHGHTYDFVVCFECKRVEIYRDSADRPITISLVGDNIARDTTSQRRLDAVLKAIQQRWDGALKEAHVPLAAAPPADENGI